MNPASLGQQFEPYTGGPEAIRAQDFQRRHGLGTPEEEEEAGGVPVQKHLFDPKTVPAPEPHTQTPGQFAADPRTWWHGRFTGQRSRLSGGGSAREGFHAGTRGAAMRRLEVNEQRRGEKPGMRGHLFPLRITGPVSAEVRDEPEPQKKTMWGKGGSIVHTELGGDGLEHGYLYRNAVEAAGSISVGVPRRAGFLATHRELVEQAQKGGKSVHPLIAWAAKKHPEHTGEAYPQHRYRLTEPSPEGRRYAQPGLAESLPTHEGYEVQRKMFPSSERSVQRSYQTEGGKTMHVRRYRESGEGTALLGQQWEPDWHRM